MESTLNPHASLISEYVAKISKTTNADGFGSTLTKFNKFISTTLLTCRDKELLSLDRFFAIYSHSLINCMKAEFAFEALPSTLAELKQKCDFIPHGLLSELKGIDIDDITTNTGNIIDSEKTITRIPFLKELPPELRDDFILSIRNHYSNLIYKKYADITSSDLTTIETALRDNTPEIANAHLIERTKELHFKLMEQMANT